MQCDIDVLTTNSWIRRLRYLQKHRLKRAYGIVITTQPMQSCVLPLVAPRRRRIHRDNLMMMSSSTRVNVHGTKERTSFASFKPSSHRVNAMYAILRLMRRPDGAAESSESAQEYLEMASLNCWAFTAAFPRCSSFVARHPWKSKGQ